MKRSLSIRRTAAGFTLVEALVTLAIAAILVAGLGDALSVTLQTRSSTAAANDNSTQASFAMSRMIATVRATTPPTVPSALAAAVANSTGSWLSPVTYTYDPAGGVLNEINGSSTLAIASNVTAFSAAIHVTSPPSSAVFAAPLIDLALTVGASGTVPVTLRSSARLGGGTLP